MGCPRAQPCGSVQGGPDSRDPKDPPGIHLCVRAPGDTQRQQGLGCCSQPGRPGCTLSPLKGSGTSPQAPGQQTPGGTCGGAASIPSSSPLRDAVAPTRTERGSRAAPTPVVPLLADPGGGMAAGSPRAPPRRWRGQPAQVALRHGRLGPAACGVPGKGCVPATLQGREQSRGSLMAHGVRSRGGAHNAVPCAVPSASALTPEPCKVINQGHGQVTGSWWVKCEGGHRISSLGPKEMSWPTASGGFGSV